MPAALSVPTLSTAKKRAREVRANLALIGKVITHSEALEHVAKELGFRNWNVAAARLSNRPQLHLSIGDRVSGRYLKQPFEGTVLSVHPIGHGDAYQLTLQFDEAVDVVRFESFSAYRQRVNATVSPEGVTWAKTSDGAPHLVLDL
ncbi:glyoxalase superfamily protein [Pseudovibrio sp. SPO723]|uniref:glyoxalase superfamily protein n=1 Tax=Nesiotobacter zosterae TaxID=392721 RepID=UPI0029C5A63B|nr:glyoxalase superfamily protein [Pseudovibrio sp. SPO723]MDX5594974.1 glyoxalase superfamily protein [Pseudovibrio sp. SPO723]